MSYLTIPWAFARTKKPQASSDTRKSYIEVRDSKARGLLGISEAEFETASVRSIASSSRDRLQSVSFSETSTIHVRDSITDKEAELAKLDTASLISTSNLSLVAPAEEYKDNNSISGLRRVKSYASSSTLRSYYDSKRAPLSVSQQTSNSSTRDFALRKGTASILSSVGQEMEHARHFLSFKGSRLGSRNSKHPTIQLNGNHVGEEPLPHSTSKEALLDDTKDHRTAAPSIASATSKPSPQRFRPGTSLLDGTPHVKINIRRPKAGAKHWFDGHEGDSSDEEASNEPEFQQAFVDQVHEGFHNHQVPEINVLRAKPSEISTTQKRKVPYTLMPPLTSHLPGPLNGRSAGPHSRRKTSIPRKPAQLSIAQEVEVPKSKSNTLATANLKEQSVLSFSSSDDEDNDEQRRQLYDRAPLVKPLPTIRDSIVTDILDDSEVEVGFAQTIHNMSGESMLRVSPIRADTTPKAQKMNHGLDEGAHTPPDQNMSEKDLITSFPATPTDSNPRRASLRASIAFSDTASMTSTRLMKVTKQEERLLAAMRVKRAAMREADRAAGRKSALQVLESGGRSSPALTEDTQSLTDDQTSLDTRLSSRYMPPRAHSRQRSYSGTAVSMYPRGSGTTFQTSTGSPSVRDSQATLRSNLSDVSERRYSIYSRSETQSLRLPRDLHTRRNTARDTFSSLTSESSGNHRDSHVVMLDGLDESLERRTIPSHLFMEAPFIGWEQIGLTAAH